MSRALQQHLRLLHVLHERLPSYWSVKTFLQLETMPGPSMALQDSPFQGLANDQKKFELRSLTFTFKLLLGGTYLNARGRRITHKRSLRSGSWLIQRCKTPQGFAILLLKVHSMHVCDVDDAILQVGLGALMPGGNRTDLEAAVDTCQRPLSLLSVQLIWPPCTALQLRTLLQAALLNWN
jgi:hypothetical protein